MEELLDQREHHPNDKLGVAPRVALTRLTPPERKRSKGNWALVGARGVFIAGWLGVTRQVG